jgi:uncharacterized repeat protein (TIGR02543 family)
LKSKYRLRQRKVNISGYNTGLIEKLKQKNFQRQASIVLVLFIFFQLLSPFGSLFRLGAVEALTVSEERLSTESTSASKPSVWGNLVAYTDQVTESSVLRNRLVIKNLVTKSLVVIRNEKASERSFDNIVLRSKLVYREADLRNTPNTYDYYVVGTDGAGSVNLHNVGNKVYPTTNTYVSYISGAGDFVTDDYTDNSTLPTFKYNSWEDVIDYKICSGKAMVKMADNMYTLLSSYRTVAGDVASYSDLTCEVTATSGDIKIAWSVTSGSNPKIYTALVDKDTGLMSNITEHLLPAGSFSSIISYYEDKIYYNNPANGISAFDLSKASYFAIDETTTRVASTLAISKYQNNNYLVWEDNRATDHQIYISSFAQDLSPASDPTSVVATPGTARITLSWVEPTNPDYMGIRMVRSVDRSPLTPEDGTVIFVGKNTSYTDLNLVSGSRYYYRVFSEDSSGNLSEGVAVSGVPSGSLPSTVELKVTLSPPIGYNGFSPGRITGLASPYNYGAEAAITAVDNEHGYYFTHWSGDCSGTTKSITLEMNKNRNCVANFSVKSNVSNTYTLSTAILPSGSGAISGNQVSYAIASPATSATITATANPGYAFSSWSGNCQSSTATAVVSMTSNKICYANFIPLSIGTDVSPAITTQPQNQVVVQGGNATFSVSASGTAPLSYQWQTASADNGAAFEDVSGANSASYQKSGVLMSDNGKKYRCIVSNDLGSVYSNQAVLSVTQTQTYKVVYNGNGSTGGSVPTDNANYESGASVTVMGNTGNLVKSVNNSAYTFSGWNTSADGTGTDRTAGSTFSMPSAAVTLYAKWTANAIGLPTVQTGSDELNLTSSSVTLGGYVSGNSAGNAVTERGVVYGTSASPTVANTKVIHKTSGGANSTGAGTYTVDITGLISGTKYYYRAYAINSSGTAYGNDNDFTTTGSPSTKEVTTSNKSSNVSKVGGAVIFNFGNTSDTKVGSGFNVTASEINRTNAPTGKSILRAFDLTTDQADKTGYNATIALSYPTGQTYKSGDKVMYWDTTSNSWSENGITNIPGTVGASTITFNTTHFTEFAILTDSSNNTGGTGGTGGTGSTGGTGTTGTGGTTVGGILPTAGSTALNMFLNFMLAMGGYLLLQRYLKRSKYAAFVR